MRKPNLKSFGTQQIRSTASHKLPSYRQPPVHSCPFKAACRSCLPLESGTFLSPSKLRFLSGSLILVCVSGDQCKAAGVWLSEGGFEGSGFQVVLALTSSTHPCSSVQRRRVWMNLQRSRARCQSSAGGKPNRRLAIPELAAEMNQATDAESASAHQ